MSTSYLQRVDNEEFLVSVARAMTTGDTGRGTSDDFHRLDYSEVLSVAATVNTPLSVRLGRVEAAKDLTHFWLEQYLDQATDQPSITGSLPGPGSETADPSEDGARKPKRYSNTMMKLARSFSITDEMQIIARAGGLHAVGTDEFARQMQMLLRVMLRDQERAILESVENTNKAWLVGQTSNASNAIVSLTVNATGGVTAVTSVTAGSGYTTSEICNIVQYGNGSGGTVVTSNTTGSAFGTIVAGSGYVDDILDDKRMMKGLLGDYKTPLAGTAGDTARGWIGSVAGGSTVYDLAGKQLSNAATAGNVVNIEDALNTIMRQIAELESGDMPSTLYVPSLMLNPLMKAAKEKLQINVNLSDLQNGSPKFVAGGAIGKFYCDFGSLDIIWHPMLYAAPVSGGTAGTTDANSRKSRLMLLNESHIKVIDYLNAGGFQIDMRPQSGPTEKKVVSQYLSLELRMLKAHGFISDFFV